MTNPVRISRLGIVVGGGPAPGINSVIHSATIEAINNGIEVIGIFDGFKHLMQGQLISRPLVINDVSRIHLTGGSILRTSRANPTKSDELLSKCVDVLLGAGIDALLAIGGDDTAFSAYKVAQYAENYRGLKIKTAHIPKTIDNDLPLPEEIRTFGYETARELGSRLVINLMEDAQTSVRWFLAVTMGRKTGHLALGIGKSSGATLTLIPEEWKGREIRLQEVLDILITSIIRRQAEGKPHGVALVAEGVMEYMSRDDLGMLETIERDAHGHIQLAEVNFAEILKKELRVQLKALGMNVSLVSKDLGYELRCAEPISFDIDYTRSLGEAAIGFLLQGGTHSTITIQHNQVVPIPLNSMMDPNTGRTTVRAVNTDSFTYQSAYKFMIRLKPQHAQDEMLLARMAAQTNLTLDEFKTRFGYLVGIAPRPF